MKKIVEVEVESNSYEVGQAVVGLIRVIRTQADDGLTLDDIPPVLTEAVAALVKVVAASPSIPAESQENIEAFINSWTLSGGNVLGVFLKKTSLTLPPPVALP